MYLSYAVEMSANIWFKN